MSEEKMREALPCPFCGGQVDPDGWLDGNGKRGPECDECGATAESMDVWNSRAALQESEAGAVDIGAMVNRFLGWKIPDDFNPDGGISFKRESDFKHPEFGRLTGIAEFEAFAQAIEAHVREECAAICEAHGNERWIIRPTSITDDPWKVGVFDCVELLRGDYKL